MTSPWRPATYEPLSVTPRESSEPPKVPLCRYGVHCQRPGCIYRHPPQKGAAHRTPCLAFLMDPEACLFGEACWHWHPATATERQQVLRALKRRPCNNPRPCRFGGACLFACSG